MPKQNPHSPEHDADIAKGAVEQQAPGQEGHNSHESLAGQLPHRTENPLIKGNDTDFPEPGESPEHSGEAIRGERSNPEGQHQTQEPGHRQKQNQNQEKDDPLAA